MRAHNQIHAKEEMKTMKKYTTIIMVNKEKTNFNKNYIVGCQRQPENVFYWAA
jgi:hypothetical protein